MVWYGMVEVCEGAPVAVSGWVLADRHDVRPCAASSLHRGTITVSNIIGGTGTLVVVGKRCGPGMDFFQITDLGKDGYKN